MTRALAAVILLLTLAATARAEDGAGVGCPPPDRAPAVRVEVSEQPLTYDFTISRADLTRLTRPGIGGMLYYSNVATGGLHQSQTTASAEFLPRGVKLESAGISCMWVDEVVVRITIAARIYVARDFPQGSCRFQVTLDHEHLHHALERALVRRHFPQITETMKLAINKVGMVGPVPLENKDAVAERINDYMQKAAQASLNFYYTERDQAQASIDTLAEYRRLDSLCR